jgi:hypothetical protein
VIACSDPSAVVPLPVKEPGTDIFGSVGGRKARVAILRAAIASPP